MRILVADDDEALRELLVEFLTDEGHTPTGAATPQEALSLARGQRWDLFLTDTLGQADHGLSEECKGFVQALAARAPVILCTARSWAGDLEAREVGAAAIIRKPFEIAALLAVVETTGRP
jgi:DNA-binding response OmpR family regulator